MPCSRAGAAAPATWWPPCASAPAWAPPACSKSRESSVIPKPSRSPHGSNQEEATNDEEGGDVAPQDRRTTGTEEPAQGACARPPAGEGGGAVLHQRLRPHQHQRHRRLPRPQALVGVPLLQEQGRDHL